MRRLIQLIFLAGIPFFSNAQENNPLIKSDDIIKEADTEANNKHYKAAIQLLDKIPAWDSGYARSLLIKSSYFISDSNYENALACLDKGIALKSGFVTRYRLLKASLLVDMKRYDECLKTLDEGMAAAPNISSFYSTKGVLYLNQGNYAAAFKNLRQAVTLNPYNEQAHYNMGRLFFETGKLSAAFMAYETSLLVSPESRFKTSIINNLSALSKATNEVRANREKKDQLPEGNMDVTDEIILSKIALDKQYKLEVDLEDPIVRQTQVLVEKISENESTDDFVEQYYGAYFKQLKGKYLESFVYSIFSGLSIKEVNEWMRKHKSDVSEMNTALVKYFNLIRKTREITPAKQAAAPIQYYFDNAGNFSGFGNLKVKGDKEVLTGKWTFYHSNGLMASTGTFDENGQKTGTWEYYFDNGALKERNGWKTPEQDGTAIIFFKNGKTSQKTVFKNGKYDGEILTYYFNGVLQKKESYKEGKLDGPYKHFYISGIVSYEGMMKDDVNNGLQTAYHENGALKYRINMVAGVEEGMLKKYFDNGKLWEEGEIRKGKREGSWKEYYETGEIRSRKNYLDGEMDGIQETFHTNGKLYQHIEYRKGKMDGKELYYDEDGLLYCEAGNDNDNFKNIRYLDKEGKELGAYRMQGGRITYSTFDPEGYKTSERTFSKKNQQDGKNTNYFRNGAVASSETYDKGKLTGEALYYFSNGNLKIKTNYTNNERDGYNKEYHRNGVLRVEGWYTEGYKQGSWIFYDENGVLSSIENYKDNDLHGDNIVFYPNGKKKIVYGYDNGWIRSITQYDTLEHLLTEVDLSSMNAPVTLKHSNGNTSSQYSIVNGMINGSFVDYFYDGKILRKFYYKNDQPDSTYIAYHYNGKTAVEGKYRNGQMEGKWKYYDDWGRLTREENYLHGELNGPFIYYNLQGKKEREINYRTGDLHGNYNYYGSNEELGGTVFFHDDHLIGYTYEDAGGKLVPMIRLKDGTGHIKTFYPNGQVGVEMDYKDDEANGKRTVYYSSGKVLMENSFTNGWSNDKTSYFPNGKISKQEPMKNNNYEGLVRYYNEAGVLLQEESYANDILHGYCRYYNELTGKLKETHYYYHGGLIQVLIN